MIKRSTWILLVILALVVGAYFVIKAKISGASTESIPTALGDNFLLTQADGRLLSIRISDKHGKVVQMQRDTSGTWIVTLPTTGAADQSLAEAAETQVDALRIVTTLNNQLNLVEAGLVSPAFSIELIFSNALKHTIQVGPMTPTNSGYYIRFDSQNVYVVSQAGIDALLNLLTSPPFAATQTAMPPSDATVIPTFEVATSTP